MERSLPVIPSPPSPGRVTRRTALRDLTFVIALSGLGGSIAGCGADAPTPSPSVGAADVARSDIALVSAPADAVPAAARAVTAFSSDLVERALSGRRGNLVCAPFSVIGALGMTANGARGRTLTEMLDVLGFADSAELDAGLAALAALLRTRAGTKTRSDHTEAVVALDVANALWGQRGVTWQRPFLDDLARWYGAGVHLVDYERATEAARLAINAWVSDSTHAKIPQLLAPGILSTLTRLVLVNTLYLKAPWEFPFVKELTAPGPFTADDGTRSSVPMMTGSGGFDYASGPGWQSVQLPYAGRELAMTLVRLEDGSVQAARAWLAGGGLGTALGAGRRTPVSVMMPRFTFRTPLSLNEILVAMGMPTAFGETADFSGMTTEVALLISAVVHETFIAVNEDGTEAAAATAVVMDVTSAPAEPEKVVLDRPFLFVVHDIASRTPLVLGRVADPGA